ncbi:10750_t:CDS:2 [Funneliformis geosporum]|nr:10750_t:CDS:2 [Funneliformis geosporum]
MSRMSRPSQDKTLNYPHPYKKKNIIEHTTQDLDRENQGCKYEELRSRIDKLETQWQSSGDILSPTSNLKRKGRRTFQEQEKG